MQSMAVSQSRNIGGRNWPGRAKDDSRLLAEKLSFGELRYRKFRRTPQRPVVACAVQRRRFTSG